MNCFNMKKIFTILLLVCCGVVGWAQTVVFVASNGNDNNNGSSWALAKQTIAAGISAAGTDGTVYVKAGSYGISAQLVIPAGVAVKGGYKLTASGTDTNKRELPGANNRWENASICTIITGNGSHRIASVSGLLEGCVLRRGYTNATGGGTYIDGGTVRYCVITECDAINESSLAAEGGGAYILNGGTLTNSVVTECRGDKGPAVSGGNGSLINNTITRNWPTHCGTVADYDGNVYTTVVIGQQCWTKQNMRTTHYNDGTAIPFGADTSTTQPYYYVNYAGVSPQTLENYGYLYNWPAAMHGAPSSNSNPSGVTGICPRGWHVPSDAEWIEMTNFVNSIARYRCSGYDAQIAKSLSSKSGWNNSNNVCEIGNNQGGNNATMFTAYPAGYYNNSYNSMGALADFWSSTELNSSDSWRRGFYSSYSTVDRVTNSKDYAFSVRCVKQIDELPEVHTTEAIMNTSTQALVKGFCQDAGSDITEYGFCWSTSHNPTVENNHIQGIGVAQFSGVISGLTSGVTYYVRAYAVNYAGISYGEERTIVSGDCGTITVTDYDGNQYNTVQIGSQCWMKENLRVTHYSNGSEIPLGSSTSSTMGYRYYLNNDPSTVNEYGYLYNWNVTVGSSVTGSHNMPATGSETLTVTETMMIYDPGGPNSGYTNYCNATLVLQPATEGSILIIFGDYNTESCCDHLYIYDGVGTSQLIGSYQGAGSLSITSQSGPLTLRFTSDGSVQSSGFSLRVVADLGQSICPIGWHLPSDAEWTQLTDYLSSTAADVCGGNTANIAKSIAASSGWSPSSVECAVGNDPSNNNTLNFGALPAGAYNGEYVNFGDGAYYWSLTPASFTQSWCRSITYDSPSVVRSLQNNSDAYSVRCVRN